MHLKFNDVSLALINVNSISVSLFTHRGTKKNFDVTLFQEENCSVSVRNYFSECTLPIFYLIYVILHERF
jgi:hypothetical protein